MNTQKLTKKDIIIMQAKPMGNGVQRTAPLFDGKHYYY